MANRYTKTTLTKREVETINGCYHRLLTIWSRRKDNPNEIKAPIEQLSKILDNMIMLDGTVTRAKMTIKFEAMEE